MAKARKAKPREQIRWRVSSRLDSSTSLMPDAETAEKQVAEEHRNQSGEGPNLHHVFLTTLGARPSPRAAPTSVSFCSDGSWIGALSLKSRAERTSSRQSLLIECDR